MCVNEKLTFEEARTAFLAYAEHHEVKVTKQDARNALRLRRKVDRDKDNALSKQEMQDAMFTGIDLQNGGKKDDQINLMEMQNALEGLMKHLGVPQETINEYAKKEAKNAFEHYNTDKDAVITKSEWIENAQC
mmetsp:Transcript_52196/g.93623  ORF Transcript_52196/g.93623 Transcript_52196/m.93623 type:complete len:133 (-) Transcript_52196:79-477(-)